MFAVYRTTTNQCDFYTQLLFVTESEQTAKDSVALAELELEQALNVPRPTWTIDDIKEKGHSFLSDLCNQYNEQIKTILTIDVPDQGVNYMFCLDKNDVYFYEPVQVR